jgi:ribosomal protein S9
MAEKQKFTAIGRRKRSVAKVTLVAGKGNITVNGKDVKDYMPYETLVMDLVQPLDLVEAREKFDHMAYNGELDYSDGEVYDSGVESVKEVQ